MLHSTSFHLCTLDSAGTLHQAVLASACDHVSEWGCLEAGCIEGLCNAQCACFWTSDIVLRARMLSATAWLHAPAVTRQGARGDVPRVPRPLHAQHAHTVRPPPVQRTKPAPYLACCCCTSALPQMMCGRTASPPLMGPRAAAHHAWGMCVHLTPPADPWVAAGPRRRSWRSLGSPTLSSTTRACSPPTSTRRCVHCMPRHTCRWLPRPLPNAFMLIIMSTRCCPLQSVHAAVILLP